MTYDKALGIYIADNVEELQEQVKQYHRRLERVRETVEYFKEVLAMLESI